MNHNRQSQQSSCSNILLFMGFTKIYRHFQASMFYKFGPIRWLRIRRKTEVQNSTAHNVQILWCTLYKTQHNYCLLLLFLKVYGIFVSVFKLVDFDTYRTNIIIYEHLNYIILLYWLTWLGFNYLIFAVWIIENSFTIFIILKTGYK